jgi:glyoxylase-like metal-dependent hydrolase (beta-lactamase superfamily II)
MSESQTVTPGLHVVSGMVNIFVLDDEETGVTVIDAGMPGSLSSVMEVLEGIGRKPEDVKHILITHADLDHVGGLHRLVAASGATVVASAESARHIQRRSNPPHLKFPMRLISRVVSLISRRAVPVEHVVADGDTLDLAGGLRVLETPGHTPDHLSFYWERERVLFAGDLLRNTHGLALTPAPITWNTEAAQRSARTVLALQPEVICMGHGDTWRAKDHPEGLEALLASFA